jgi:hypothetical protein
VSATFIRVSSALLLSSMLPLAVSICTDVYLIARIILGSMTAAVVASALLVFFIILWFVAPRVRGLQRILAAASRRAVDPPRVDGTAAGELSDRTEHRRSNRERR